MPDSSNTNNQFNQNRVSTAGITLFDDEGIMMKLGYLGDTLSVTLGIPKPAENGKRTYPKDDRVPFLITPERAAALYNEIITNEKDGGLLAAIREDRPFNRGIFLNQNKTAVLELLYKEGEVYLVYCKNINEERAAEKSYVFHFQKTEIIDGYDPSGSFDGQSKAEGSFFVFCCYVESGVYEISGGSGHSVRKTAQYTISAIFNHLKAIAAKLGVTPDSGYRSYNNGGGSSGFMNIPDGVDDELPFADAPSSTSLEDILN